VNLSAGEFSSPDGEVLLLIYMSFEPARTSKGRGPVVQKGGSMVGLRAVLAIKLLGLSELLLWPYKAFW